MSITSPAAEAEPRYELKMVCEESARWSVLSSLRLHPAGVRKLYDERIVQSIYFDTHEGRALLDNLSGISQRQKLRLRWYGTGALGVQGTLELKIRDNMLGTKETQRLAEPIDVDGAARKPFVQAVRRLASPRFREHLDRSPEPVLWVSYLREYLVTADHAVRITIDRNLRCADQRDLPILSPRRPQLTPRLLVVECKSAASDRDRLEELLQDLPLKVDKCSKFVLGTAPGHGPLASWLGW